MRGVFMNDQEFKQMLDELVTREEQHLQVNSKEFKQRHEEIMKLLDKSKNKFDETEIRK